MRASIILPLINIILVIITYIFVSPHLLFLPGICIIFLQLITYSGYENMGPEKWEDNIKAGLFVAVTTVIAVIISLF